MRTPTVEACRCLKDVDRTTEKEECGECFWELVNMASTGAAFQSVAPAACQWISKSSVSYAQMHQVERDLIKKTIDFWVLVIKLTDLERAREDAQWPSMRCLERREPALTTAVCSIQIVASSLVFVAASKPSVKAPKSANRKPLNPMRVYLVKLHPIVAISRLPNQGAPTDSALTFHLACTQL